MRNFGQTGMLAALLPAVPLSAPSQPAEPPEQAEAEDAPQFAEEVTVTVTARKREEDVQRCPSRWRRRRGQALRNRRAETRVSYWDALIIESALDADASKLLTEDLQHGQTFGRLRLVNPFRDGPRTVAARPANRRLQLPLAPDQRRLWRLDAEVHGKARRHVVVRAAPTSHARCSVTCMAAAGAPTRVCIASGSPVVLVGVCRHFLHRKRVHVLAYQVIFIRTEDSAHTVDVYSGTRPDRNTARRAAVRHPPRQACAFLLGHDNGVQGPSRHWRHAAGTLRLSHAPLHTTINVAIDRLLSPSSSGGHYNRQNGTDRDRARRNGRPPIDSFPHRHVPFRVTAPLPYVHRRGRRHPRRCRAYGTKYGSHHESAGEVHRPAVQAPLIETQTPFTTSGSVPRPPRCPSISTHPTTLSLPKLEGTASLVQPSGSRTKNMEERTVPWVGGALAVGLLRLAALSSTR